MAERTPAEKAIRSFPFWNYGMDDVDPKAKTAMWVGDLAAAAEKAVRKQVAEEIERELVCCNIFERIEALPCDSDVNLREHFGSDYHSICHWGGFAAAIARGKAANHG